MTTTAEAETSSNAQISMVDEQSTLLPDHDTTVPCGDEDGETTEDETVSAEILLEDCHAKYNPKCMFASENWGTGRASVGNEITSLLKNIVGSGGLSLPAGIAAFGNRWSAVIPSIVVIFIMGIVNAYSFSLLGRVCSVTKSKTYGQAWHRTGKVSRSPTARNCLNSVLCASFFLSFFLRALH